MFVPAPHTLPPGLTDHALSIVPAYPAPGPVRHWRSHTDGLHAEMRMCGLPRRVGKRRHEPLRIERKSQTIPRQGGWFVKRQMEIRRTAPNWNGSTGTAATLAVIRKVFRKNHQDYVQSPVCGRSVPHHRKAGRRYTTYTVRQCALACLLTKTRRHCRHSSAEWHLPEQRLLAGRLEKSIMSHEGYATFRIANLNLRNDIRKSLVLSVYRRIR